MTQRRTEVITAQHFTFLEFRIRVSGCTDRGEKLFGDVKIKSKES